MTAAERIAKLEAENAALRAELAVAQHQVTLLTERLRELEQRLTKNSHNSSKPPSSDGLRRRSRPQRVQSERKPGGQPDHAGHTGHTGHTLALIAIPDVEVLYRPAVCSACQCPLEGVAGQVIERRQVQDLPPLTLVVTEHQVEAVRLEAVRCPQCQAVTRGTFPAAVCAPAYYGPQVRAWAVYLNQYQLLPEARTCETLLDLGGCALADGTVARGTVARWVQEAAEVEVLAPTVAHIADLVAASPVPHADETGMRLEGRLQGRLHWLQVNSTRWLTHLAWHPKRGQQALEAIGIWPRFRGWAIHDRWASYEQYSCLHSRCKAHLLRDLTFLAEEAGQAWASELKSLLMDVSTAVRAWQQRGVRRRPSPAREDWLAQYFQLLSQGYATQGYATQAPPTPTPISKRRGRQRQSPAKHLLDACCTRPSRCWPLSKTARCPLPTIRRNATHGWSKCSKRFPGRRFPARSVARRGPPPFVGFGALFPRCASRAVPCCPRSAPSFSVVLCLSLGAPQLEAALTPGGVLRPLLQGALIQR